MVFHAIVGNYIGGLQPTLMLPDYVLAFGKSLMKFLAVANSSKTFTCMSNFYAHYIWLAPYKFFVDPPMGNYTTTII